MGAEEKNYETARRRFMWLGSGGLVHKGLDLVIEAMQGQKLWDLDICGDWDAEPDFAASYEPDVKQHGAIILNGLVDVAGDRFESLRRECAAIVFPSCSEGCNGGVVGCLHAGILPIVSRETGVDVGDFGFVLPDCRIETIRATMAQVAALPPAELEARARAGWELAQTKYTRQAFSLGYKQFLEQVLPHP